MFELSSISCPKCHHTFSLSHEFKKSLEKEFITQKNEQAKQWEAEKQKLLQEKHQLEEKNKAEYEKKLQEEKVALWKVAQQKANEKMESEFSIQIKDLQEQNKEHKKRIEESQKKELEFLKKERALEERQKSIELEMQRKMNEERKALEDQIKKQADEEHRLKLLEKDKQMDQMKKALEEAQRKGQQGSMQIQGDVQENDLKEILTAHFPLDVIEDVPTGIRGADLVHTIKNNMGQKSGTVIWESKNTKNWTEGWIQKLKDDQGNIGADIAILVSQALPEEVNHYEYRNGVWVVSYPFVLSLFTLLRHHSIEMYTAKKSMEGQDEKMTMLYSYLSSPQFKNRIENIVAAFESMKTDLDKEKRAMQNIWNRREKELERVVMNTSGLYGDLQGITGGQISHVESLSLPEELENDDKRLF